MGVDIFNNFFRGKRVLVTGHTGFKGSWLSIWLHELGAEVIGVAQDPFTERDNFVLSGIGQRIKADIRADIRDGERIKEIFRQYQPEIVFHLAAQPLVRLSYDIPVETYQTNVMGTIHILEAIRFTDSVKVGVMITTDKCYENREQIWGYRENEPMGGYDPYSSSKGAAETGTGQSMYEIEKYVGVNIGGTALMLDILTNTNHTVKKVVVAESRAIYGEGRYYSKELNQFVYPTERSEAAMRAGDFEVKYKGCDSPLKLVGTTEDSMIHPTSVYGITKQVQGQLVHLVCPSIGIASVSYRYQNVYGPGQSLSNPYTGILSIFSTRIRNGNGINIFEDGKETRDFVYIDDVVDATILGIEKEEANGHVFNVGTGVATDVLTVARTLIEKYEIDVPITISGNFRLGDIRHNYADITAARTILGFEPKWSFSDGIGEFVKWVNEQGVQEDKYEASIEEMKKKGLYK